MSAGTLTRSVHLARTRRHGCRGKASAGLSHNARHVMHPGDATDERVRVGAQFGRLHKELKPTAPHLALAAEFAVATGLRMRAQSGPTWAAWTFGRNAPGCRSPGRRRAITLGSR
jgi:hypothetical protein